MVVLINVGCCVLNGSALKLDNVLDLFDSAIVVEIWWCSSIS